MASDTWMALAPETTGLGAHFPTVDPMWLWEDATGYRMTRPHGLDSSRRGWFAVHDGRDFRSERIAPAEAAKRLESGVELEWSESVVPGRMPERPAVALPIARRDAPASEAKVIVGVIDTGCPFASAMLRRGKAGTQVLSLWDQDERPSFTTVEGAYQPAPLGYGCAVDREQLEALMADSALSGRVDESQCYRAANYDVMRRAASHGAAVLSQIFAPPVHGGALDVATKGDLPRPVEADLVFVQLPRDAVQDSTSGALARCLIDGLRWIRSHATKDTQRIVVNISSGTSRTLHDGSSLIERALVALSAPDENGPQVDISIVVAAGNTNEEQRCACLSSPGAKLDLFLPPGCEMAQFVTVRWPAEAANVRLKVTPPGGAPGVIGAGQALGWPSVQDPVCGVISPARAADQASRSLLVFAPTVAADASRRAAPSGRWTLELDFEGEGDALPQPVMFWVSRNQRNFGALRRSSQAAFIDSVERHNPRRYLRRTQVDPRPVMNGIVRDGAVSGLATAAGDSAAMRVVGAYVVATKEPSRYSAYSGMVSNPLGERSRPELFAPGDSSPGLPGLTVKGNRSGDIVRVTGTSFAAPLVTRWLATELNPDSAQLPGWIIQADSADGETWV